MTTLIYPLALNLKDQILPMQGKISRMKKLIFFVVNSYDSSYVHCLAIWGQLQLTNRYELFACSARALTQWRETIEKIPGAELEPGDYESFWLRVVFGS